MKETPKMARFKIRRSLAILMLVVVGLSASCRADPLQDLLGTFGEDNVGKAKALLDANPALVKTQPTLLQSAAGVGAPRITLLLLMRGADVNAKDAAGQTALHKAAGRPGFSRNDFHTTFMLELLIAAGADVNVLDQAGRSPLHDAAQRGIKERVGLLLTKSVHDEQPDKNAITPLDEAVFGRQEDRDIVGFMTDKGVRLTIFAATYLGKTQAVADYSSRTRSSLRLRWEAGESDKRLFILQRSMVTKKLLSSYWRTEQILRHRQVSILWPLPLA